MGGVGVGSQVKGGFVWAATVILGWGSVHCISKGFPSICQLNLYVE